jgi:hypothetical protein
MTAPDLTNERLRQIIEAAGKATPGPWEWHRYDYGSVVTATNGPRATRFIVRDDATHIANCDPATIAATAGEIVRLRDETAMWARLHRDTWNAIPDRFKLSPTDGGGGGETPFAIANMVEAIARQALGGHHEP